MITNVGGEPDDGRRHPAAPSDGAYFEFFNLERGQPHAVATSPCRCCSPAMITTLLGVLARRRSPPGAPCGRVGRRRRRPPRRSPAATSTPGCAPTDDPDLGVLASSFNDMAVGAAAARRARRPLRLRRQPRAALAADDAVGVGRGDGGPPRRDARAGPGGARPAGRATSPGSRAWSRTSSRSAGSTPARSGSTSRTCQRAEFVRNAVAVSRRRDTPVTVSRAGRAGDHPRRPSPAGPRDRQPHRQRPRLRRRRARGHDHRRQRCRTSRSATCRIAVEDHGPGVPGRGAGADLRALRPRRACRPAQRQRGRRPRPGARRRARAHARRPGVGRGPPRRRARGPLRDRAAGRAETRPGVDRRRRAEDLA